METHFHSIEVHSEAELPAAVGEIFGYAKSRRKFALSGDLGAGKTTFTQYFCKKMGVKDRVSSPTYALVNEYAFKDEEGVEQPFYHIDLYRVKDMQEALDIGIEDYLFDENYCFIEWPDVVEPLLPEDVVRIKITILPDSGRKILFL